MRQSWEAFLDQYAGSPPVPESERAYTDGNNLRVLCALAHDADPACLLEIGTAYGHTAVILAKLCPSSQLWTLGTCREYTVKTRSVYDREILPREEQGSFIKIQPEELRARIHARVLRSRGRSVLCAADVPHFQFAFIDGDHMWRGVVEDTKAVMDRIDSRGTVVWDDYGYALEVAAFIDLLNARTGSRIVSVCGTRICYVKLDPGLQADLVEALQDL